MSENRRVLLLCNGLQSSGSTLVSWCFLQRSDTDGVLDARNDVLPEPPQVDAPLTWLKMTLACFRSMELIGHYQDEGWDVRPMLVVRDVRAVFGSLASKHYGANGTTAEEPPLRMRLRRFKDDWLKFRDAGWPILRYESFVVEPEAMLRRTCDALDLEWDDSMLTWPKPFEAIAAAGHGNSTFRTRRGTTFAETVDPDLAVPNVDRIGVDDLRWLETEFADFNAAHDYPAELRPNEIPADLPPRAVPKWENTRRFSKSQRPLTRLTTAFSRWKHETLLGDARKVRRLRCD